MPKPQKKPASVKKPTHSPAPWSCRHHADVSEIFAYTEPNGVPQVIAETFSLPGANAKHNAEAIVHAVNGHEQTKELMAQMLNALELCLDCGGLTWEAEQEAESVYKKLKKADESGR